MPRLLMALRPVNENGTRTTSPWLKLVVNGILGVVPKLERRLGGFEPGDIVRLNFQIRRQIVKEPHLVPHIQVLNCLADFLNRAHAGNFSRKFSDEKVPLHRGVAADFNSAVSFCFQRNMARDQLAQVQLLTGVVDVDPD